MSTLLKNIMKEYFDNEGHSPCIADRLGMSMTLTRDVPVVAKKTEGWEIVTDPNRLKRDFEFDSYERMWNFLNELLLYQEEVQHHGKIIIDHRKVIVEVYTHDVDDVTEIDKEYAQTADDIFDDVQYININKRIDDEYGL
jgi:4a-hydroxytetrahydrobiopterin dehydratase